MNRSIALCVVLVAGCSSTTDATSTDAAKEHVSDPIYDVTTTQPPPTTTITSSPVVSSGRPPTSVAHPPASASTAPPSPSPSPPPVARAEAGGAVNHGKASWYGSESGSTTASGDHFDPDGLTAAHRTLAFGTRLRVCRDGCVVVAITDRGPARWTGRELDLSRAAFAVIAPLGSGVVDVTWEAA